MVLHTERTDCTHLLDGAHVLKNGQKEEVGVQEFELVPLCTD